MTDRTESGRYSLAGFLYQIVGSGVEGFRIAKHENDSEGNEILELEQLGQDLVGRSADNSGGIRLIQFKYSSTNAIVNPSELRTILQAFFECAREANKNVEDCTYELRTNRELHSGIVDWFCARKNNHRDKLRDAIRATSQSGVVDDLDEICEIFERFNYLRLTDADLKRELEDAAAKLGMLKKEIPGGVNRLIGFLATRSAEPGERRVLLTELQSEFAGHIDPFELLSEPSISLRCKDIDSFQQEEASKSASVTRALIVKRTKTEDIVLALLQYPVVVVHGDGGCGKSIAVADALMSCLQDQHQPPGFSLISRAQATNPSIVISKIAAWRNCRNHSDGADFSEAFTRLKSSYGNSPVFVICFDAIDEKQGAALAEETLTFIRELIRLAVESRAPNGTPLVSVILTCRRKDEVGNIPRNLNPIAPEEDVKDIHIEDYDDEELIAAIRDSKELQPEVAQQIEAMLGSTDLSTASSRRTNVDVSSEVIELIRHPVLWYVFSQLNSEQQRQCLAGDQQALHHLGSDYLKWFQKKAACRITNLQLGECCEALSEAAKTFDVASAIGFRDANWLQPVTVSIGNRLQAKLLYDEAITAGLILEIDQRDKSWRWRHPWLCSFLEQNEGVSQ